MLVEAWNIKSLEYEIIPITQALGRILANHVVSGEDIPPFQRSTVDGYAVKASDTFGASEMLPAILEITEKIEMGRFPEKPISEGQSAQISTGGILPKGSDACVMVEYTHLADTYTLLVEKPVSLGENVVQKGEDICEGEVLLSAGQVLRPSDIGAMAAVGQTAAKVIKQPKIAIISTGDEIIQPHKTPNSGQIRDINTYSLSSLAHSVNSFPLNLGIAKDSYDDIKNKVERGLTSADIVVISGGTSISARDMVAEVLQEFGPPGVLVHGVSMKPGKPVIIAICQDKPVFGLPGHPVSALTTFHVFVDYAVKHLYKCSLPEPNNYISSIPPIKTIQAYLSKNISSVPGREDYVRVRLRKLPNRWIADPVLGKSGLISTMVASDGEIIVPMNLEGLKAGTIVQVRIF